MTFPSILKAGTKSLLICQPVGRGLLKSSGNWFCSSIPGGIGTVPFYLSIPDVAQAVARKKLKLTNVREGRGLGREEGGEGGAGERGVLNYILAVSVHENGEFFPSVQ